MCYLAVTANRWLCYVNSNFLGLALFLTTNLPKQVYPLIWLQRQGNVNHSVSDAIQLVTAFASAVCIPLLTPGHVSPSSSSFHPMESCSPASRWWLYTWVSPMVNKGCRNHGVMSSRDLLPIKENNLAEAWVQTYRHCHQVAPSFRASLWKLFRRRLTAAACWAMLCGFFELAGTIGLHQLLLFLQRSPETKLRPWFSVFLFGCCPILRGLCMQTFEY